LVAMPIGDEARDVIRHALLWVWKDEEMHTIYVRGALLKLGSLRLRVSSTIQQLTGWIGGWASSVQHHVRWRDAPLSRLFAALFTAAGALVGKVPRAVARELRFGSFGSFCRFNVDGERTAALGSGGPVWVVCGERAEDKLPLFRRLLDAAGLRRRLEECARAGGKPIGELRIAIKPSFMLGYHRKDRSCLTDPELVRELARYL